MKWSSLLFLILVTSARGDNREDDKIKMKDAIEKCKAANVEKKCFMKCIYEHFDLIQNEKMTSEVVCNYFILKPEAAKQKCIEELKKIDEMTDLCAAAMEVAQYIRNLVGSQSNGKIRDAITKCRGENVSDNSLWKCAFEKIGWVVDGKLESQKICNGFFPEEKDKDKNKQCTEAFDEMVEKYGLCDACTKIANMFRPKSTTPKPSEE